VTGPTEAPPGEQPFAKLLTRFVGLAERAARMRGLDAAEVDEIVQDVRIRLWRVSERRENVAGIQTSYFMRVVSSAIIDHLRRRRRNRSVPFDALAEDETPAALHVVPDDSGQRDALAMRLRSALATLPRNRRVLVQLYLEGFTREEMSRMTAWSEPKVRNLLYRGLEDVRNALSQTPDP